MKEMEPGSKKKLDSTKTESITEETKRTKKKAYLEGYLARLKSTDSL